MKQTMLLLLFCVMQNLFAVESFLPGHGRPNIILAMADDQGWGDVGYNGHPHLKTPNLDKLAASGLRFDRFYSGAPVCSPTRASVMTGRNPLRCGVPNVGNPINLSERTIAQVLRENGYRTGHFGKWHLRGGEADDDPTNPRLPSALGYDEYAENINKQSNLDPQYLMNGVAKRFTGDSSDVVVSLANDFITRSVQNKQSFFVTIWYTSPHLSHKGLPEYKKPYEQYAVPGGKFPEVSKAQMRNKETIPNFYAEIAGIDHSMGTLVDKLKELGVADNTLIWYCSDNGGLMPELSEPGLKGLKGDTWEGGIRVPGFIVWPQGIPAPKVTSLRCSTMDIYPTVLSVLGMTETAKSVLPIDGQDVSALFAGELNTHKPIPISHNSDDVIIDGKYKLHKRANDKKAFQLYDLDADPGETHDISDDMPAELARMKGLLAEWQESLKRSMRGVDYQNGKKNEE